MQDDSDSQLHMLHQTLPVGGHVSLFYCSVSKAGEICYPCLFQNDFSPFISLLFNLLLPIMCCRKVVFLVSKPPPPQRPMFSDPWYLLLGQCHNSPYCLHRHILLSFPRFLWTYKLVDNVVSQYLRRVFSVNENTELSYQAKFSSVWSRLQVFYLYDCLQGAQGWQARLSNVYLVYSIAGSDLSDVVESCLNHSERIFFITPHLKNKRKNEPPFLHAFISVHTRAYRISLMSFHSHNAIWGRLPACHKVLEGKIELN